MEIQTTPKVKADLFITDEDQAVLIQIRDNIRNNYFAIGDIANKYVVLCNRGKKAVIAQDIYDAVGEYVGKSGRTVRYYAEQAAFYHPAVRDKYDILPFSFFVFARSMGESWEFILDYCMTKPSSSLAYVRRKFLYETEHSTASEDQDEGEIVEAASIVERNDDRTIGLFLSVMIDLSARAISMAENLPISEDARESLMSAALQIRRTLRTIDNSRQSVV